MYTGDGKRVKLRNERVTWPDTHRFDLAKERDRTYIYAVWVVKNRLLCIKSRWQHVTFVLFRIWIHDASLVICSLRHISRST
jgi:hypothetical protein